MYFYAVDTWLYIMILIAVATGVEGSGHVRVYLVKKAERGEVYKKKLTWMLRELKQVDGKDKMKVRTE